MTFRQWIGAEVSKLFHIRDKPDSVALAFALGVFLGFTPLFGLKTLLALGLAWLCGINGLAAVIGVTLHDLVLPFIPVLLRVEYQLGFWCLSHPHQFAPKLSVQHLNFHTMLSWTTFFTAGGPLLLGSLIVGLPLSSVAFFIARVFLHRRRRQSASTTGGPSEPGRSE